MEQFENQRALSPEERAYKASLPKLSNYWVPPFPYRNFTPEKEQTLEKFQSDANSIAKKYKDQMHGEDLIRFVMYANRIIEHVQELLEHENEAGLAEAAEDLPHQPPSPKNVLYAATHAFCAEMLGHCTLAMDELLKKRNEVAPKPPENVFKEKTWEISKGISWLRDKIVHLFKETKPPAHFS